MKKILLALALVMASLGGNFAEASVPSSECSIGAIYYGMPMEEVVRLYGQPQHVEKGDHHPIFRGEVVKAVYSSGKVTFVNGYARECTVHVANSDLTTPAGVMVGMRTYVLESIYGEADRNVQRQGRTRKVYFCDDIRAELVFGIEGDRVATVGFKAEG